MSKKKTPEQAPFVFEGFDHTSGATSVPDALFDVLLTKLSGAALKTFLYIIRRTIGFQKIADAISFNQFLRGITTKDGKVLDKGCGVTNRTVLSAALKELETFGCITVTKGKDPHGDNATTLYGLRFKEEVVSNPYHMAIRGGIKSVPPVVSNPYYGGIENVPGVVSNPYQQETVIQQTELQDTELQEETECVVATATNIITPSFFAEVFEDYQAARRNTDPLPVLDFSHSVAALKSLGVFVKECSEPSQPFTSEASAPLEVNPHSVETPENQPVRIGLERDCEGADNARNPGGGPPTTVQDATDIRIAKTGATTTEPPPNKGKRGSGTRKTNAPSTKEVKPEPEKPKGPPPMPAPDASLSAEILVQIMEAKKGRRYSDTTRSQELNVAKKLLKMEYEDAPISREQMEEAIDDMLSWSLWKTIPTKPMLKHLQKDDKILNILDELKKKPRKKPVSPSSGTQQNLANRALDEEERRKQIDAKNKANLEKLRQRHAAMQQKSAQKGA